MPTARDVLNELKWGKGTLEKAEVWYTHRGAPNDTRIISGSEIVNIGRSFFETTEATIPFHRIKKILIDGKEAFSRDV